MMSTRHFRILFNDMQRRAAPGTRKASKKIGSEFRIFGQAYTAKKIRMEKKMFRPHSDKKSIHERSLHAYQYITSRSLFPCTQVFHWIKQDQAYRHGAYILAINSQQWSEFTGED